MLQESPEKSTHSSMKIGEEAIKVILTFVSQAMSITPERRPEPIRVRTKGLLERRGSSASLTIELSPAPELPPRMVTPTRECTNEEFLLSAGNVLSRAQLRKVVSNPCPLHKEFWEVPLNQPECIDVCGSNTKNRYCSVLPNSRSRVILPGSDDPLLNYINANYIRVISWKFLLVWNLLKICRFFSRSTIL